MLEKNTGKSRFYVFEIIVSFTLQWAQDEPARYNTGPLVQQLIFYNVQMYKTEIHNETPASSPGGVQNRIKLNGTS